MIFKAHELWNHFQIEEYDYYAHVIAVQKQRNIPLADLWAVNFIINKKHYRCCGKVSTEKDVCHIIGYIVDEWCETWTVQLVNGENKQMKHANYYPKAPKQRIKQYRPFQILIQRSGKSKYTLNRIAFYSNLKIVPQLSS